MKHILTNYLIVIMVLAFATTGTFSQTGPGGVGGHELNKNEEDPINALWLRAEDLSLSDGDFVTVWNDVSGYNHSASPGISGEEGIYFQTNRVNGLPWVRFFGENYLKVANDPVLDGGEGFGIFVVAKRDSLVADKYENASNLVTKRAHWNAWSHVEDIPMTHEGLQHAYELRWDRARGADGEYYPDTMNITAYANGNLPDGSGADVFPTIENTAEISVPYIISYCYSNHEDSYGSFVRINGLQTSRRPEGNPNPITSGPVVQSSKDLWLGGAQYDPPGAFGNENDECPTCEETGLLEGALAEVIIYKGTLWHTQVFIIENYLSLKYDLPIDTVKYYDDDTYVFDLAGIGNEMGDDKKHSASASHALAIEELNESLDEPKEYLFAAHDGQEIQWTNDGLPDENLQRWSRTWKIEKMGNLDAQLSFNFITAELNLVNSQVPTFRLAYKENPEDDFSIIEDIEATRQLKTLHFVVPDETLQSGYYTVVKGYDPDVSTMPVADNFSASLQVFPTPAQNSVNIKFATHHTGEVSIRLVDLTGREIQGMTDYKSEDHFQTEVSVENLKQGIYFVEVIVDGKRAVKRMMKK